MSQVIGAVASVLGRAARLLSICRAWCPVIAIAVLVVVVVVVVVVIALEAHEWADQI